MDANDDLTAQSDTQYKSRDFGAALAIGMSLGLIFGMLLDNIAMGLIGGMLLATTANAISEQRRGKKHANIALIISLAGLLLLAVIWVFWG